MLELSPGAYAGLVSFEKINLPLNVFARIGSKRSLSYDGMILLTGSLVDPGYAGHLLFGVYNASQKKAIIRSGMKICSIVFEQLPSNVERKVQPDPDLLHGRLPQDFLARMANMEVLPWMQISERVKDIERITKDIIDLKARYEDVLQPIKKLTENIDRVATDVSSLTQETRRLAHDLDTLRGITSENAKQIGQLATAVGSVSGELKGVAERSRKAEDSSERQEGVLTELRTKFGRFSLVAYVFWAIVLLAAGALLPNADRSSLREVGHPIYFRSVEKAFGWNGVDYAMLVKIYGAGHDTDRGYGPPVCVGADKHRVMGRPDSTKISTSYVERQNLTLRLQNRRTNGLSKKVENHAHAVALHFMFYNFCRSHQTLTKAARGVHTTPAMAAGIADRVWKIEDLIALTDPKRPLV